MNLMKISVQNEILIEVSVHLHQSSADRNENFSTV